MILVAGFSQKDVTVPNLSKKHEKIRHFHLKIPYRIRRFGHKWEALDSPLILLKFRRTWLAKKPDVQPDIFNVHAL